MEKSEVKYSQQEAKDLVERVLAEHKQKRTEPPAAPPTANAVATIAWPSPKPLPNGLLPVDSFDMEFLPTDLRGWVSDISDRLQCPPDYVAISAIVSLGSLLGRRLGIKPQTKTDWIELANLWGMFIGRPGMLKSPAMDEALKFIRHLEAEALKEYDVAREAYEAGIEAFNLRRSVKKTLEKDALKKLGGNATGDLTSMELGDEPLEPTPVRFRTNDSTYQAIRELLVANPNGLLVERDELVSLLKHLDREEEVVARGFYLTGWGGQSPYTFDRIGRGHQHIDAVCLSVLGNTQPSRIAEYVWRANADGAGGDGLLQRFGLAAWPEPAGEWKNVDRFPDNRARETAWSVFERVAAIDHNRALKLGAELGRFDKVPSLRFDQEAAAEFLGWREDLERRLRSSDLSPALEGHLAKYRKLVPALALITHLAEGADGPVPNSALLKALAFSEYLESHARRIYGSFGDVEIAAAKAILNHIGDLQDGFTAREIQRHGWSGLTDADHVRRGLSLLLDLDHLAAKAPPLAPGGGRPSVTYLINPAIKAPKP
jgi:hypothetical protein